VAAPSKGLRAHGPRACRVYAGAVQKVNAEEVRDGVPAACTAAPKELVRLSSASWPSSFFVSQPHTPRDSRLHVPQLEQIIAERDRPLIIDFFATWCAEYKLQRRFFADCAC
jgi:hypothetical protein